MVRASAPEEQTPGSELHQKFKVRDGQWPLPRPWRVVRTDHRIMDEMTIALLAHLSAHRRLLINLYAVGFTALAKPVEAAELERKKFADAPTQAPERGSGLDQATSDMLAAMTTRRSKTCSIGSSSDSRKPAAVTTEAAPANDRRRLRAGVNAEAYAAPASARSIASRAACACDGSGPPACAMSGLPPPPEPPSA